MSSSRKSSRKSQCSPLSRRPAARIDTSLETRAQLREEFLAILKRPDYIGPLSEDEELVPGGIENSESPEGAIDALLDIMLSDDKEAATMAFLELRLTDNPYLAKRAELLLDRPGMTDDNLLRLKVLQVPASFESLNQLFAAGDPDTMSPEEIFSALTSAFKAPVLDSEFTTMLWYRLSEDFPEELIEIMMLDIARAPSESFMCISAVEMAKGDPEWMAFVARLLGLRRESEAGDCLRELLDHPSLSVRIEAESALRAHIALGPVDNCPQFVSAWAVKDSMVGVHPVLFCVRQKSGLYSLLFMVVDAWDAGIADVLSIDALFAADAELLITRVRNSSDGAGMVQVSAEEAAGWMMQAESLNQRRGKPLYPNWPNSRRLFRAVKGSVPPADVEFGRSCMECGKEYERPQSMNLKSQWISMGKIFLCPSCITKKLVCANCGKKVVLSKSFVALDQERMDCAFYCEKCNTSLPAETDGADLI